MYIGELTAIFVNAIFWLHIRPDSCSFKVLGVQESGENRTNAFTFTQKHSRHAVL